MAKDDIDRILERLRNLEIAFEAVKTKLSIATWFLAAAAGAWIMETIGKLVK